MKGRAHTWWSGGWVLELNIRRMRVPVDTVRLHFSTKYSQVWKGWKERRKCSKTICSDFLTRLTCLTLDTILWKAWLFWGERFSRSRVKFSHRTLHWFLLGDQSEWVFTASEWKQGHKTCYGFKNVPKVLHPGYTQASKESLYINFPWIHSADVAFAEDTFGDTLLKLGAQSIMSPSCSQSDMVFLWGGLCLEL